MICVSHAQCPYILDYNYTFAESEVKGPSRTPSPLRSSLRGNLRSQRLPTTLPRPPRIDCQRKLPGFSKGFFMQLTHTAVSTAKPAAAHPQGLAPTPRVGLKP